MKIVKKILRLIPILGFMSLFLAIIFNKSGYSTPNDLVSFLEIESGFLDSIVEVYFSMIPVNIFNWFNTNITTNYYLLISVSILFYELYLSIAFIMFDFINIIFTWANKLIDRGGNYE